MPFTPLHMGPGMAIKATAPRCFSIVVFGLTQIAFDLEVACVLLGLAGLAWFVYRDRKSRRKRGRSTAG